MLPRLLAKIVATRGCVPAVERVLPTWSGLEGMQNACSAWLRKVCCYALMHTVELSYPCVHSQDIP